MRTAQRSSLAAIAALALLYLALVAPNHPDAATWAALRHIPLELPLVMTLLLAVGAWPAARWPARAIVTLLIVIALLLKAADLALFGALARPFNLAYDLPLLHAAWMLLAGSSGPVPAALYLTAAVLVLALLSFVIWHATGVLLRHASERPHTVSILTAAIAVATTAAWWAGAASPFSTRLIAGHASAAMRAMQDVAALEAEAAQDPVLASVPSPLSGLAGTDIVLVFVESYGRSTLDSPLYAGTTNAALRDVERELGALGYAMRSAWLTSPTMGGQSWLAHGTLLSGLWIDGQGRYDALMRSQRKSLNRVAAEAGWRNVGVMPAIVMPWPEAAWFGYDTVLAAKDLGYRGKPFNWVTMPDQYTLSAFERLELGPGRNRPVFAEIALISSHAPWTPIPSLVPWEAVGYGTVFDAQAASGDTPEQVWADPDRVRDQFRRSIDYALRAVGSFAARHGETKPLFVILGDHQPAVFVSGSDTNRDVPIHLFGPPEAVARFDAWGWTHGLVPAHDTPVWRMDAFRARFIEAVSRMEPQPQSGVVRS
ncbi:sulfatase [Aquamicrobium terrae]|uniref:Multisubunit Na+/H+ antiporter MnhC subunit n=1 Tax=Aquamicrobium terrae TaxID=1324945 RepID=A0ABV2N4J3_9HYPH